MSGRLEKLWYPTVTESRLRSFLLSPLNLAEQLFRLAVSARGTLYRKGLFKSHQIPGTRVVSVGNLNVGGAGKTPAVIWLAQRLALAGKRVGVLSRGYGRSSSRDFTFQTGSDVPLISDVGDEPLLIARNCPEAWVLVGTNRVALARVAAQKHHCDVLILDDGFQHRRLARQVNILVLDENNPLGNGHLMPRGPLREPLSAVARADLLWIRCSASAVSNGNKTMPVFPGHSRVLAQYLGHSPEPPVQPEQQVFAFAGLARPARFLATLAELKLNVIGYRFFRDHHPYSAADQKWLLEAARAAGAKLVTTEKDAIRLPSQFPVSSVKLGVKVLEGEQMLLEMLGIG